jgi:hypothetical protein
MIWVFRKGRGRFHGGGFSFSGGVGRQTRSVIDQEWKGGIGSEGKRGAEKVLRRPGMIELMGQAAA